MNAGTIKRAVNFEAGGPARRPLARLADDKMHDGSPTTMLGRVLRETGRKSIEVAAFGSSV